ncbi:MAG: glycoside hydrolase family 3 protein [Sporocytophaga sp.]|nr:glycoside hydrolase family 3 protein [Sporocytophaga sp.]
MTLAIITIITMKIRILFLLITILISCKTKEKYLQTKSKPVETSKTKSKPILSEDSLDIMIGQMILVGLNDRTVLPANDSLRKELRAGKIGSVIIFEKNISKTKSAETLKKLIADLQAEAPIPLFVTIDEEGGKVHRLKEKYGFVKMPSAQYLGNLNNPDSTLFYTRNLAKELKGLGINLNFAPDVDLGLNKENPVIYKAGRSYSADPEIVTKQALLSIEGHHDFGVKTILKHFPGHGSSSVDSHLGIVDITNQWKIMEIWPYRDIIRSGNCDAVMTAHIINCHLDTSCLPATLSKPIINGILRDLLQFDGVVFSDDMQMNAISKNYGLENAIKLSINAGVDILLFGNNVHLEDRISATQIHAVIKKLVKSGEIKESRIEESFRRIMALKDKKFN